MSESQVTTIARQFIEQADPRALQAELLSIIDQLPQANAIMIEHEVITAEEIFAACEVAKPRPLTRSDAKQKKLMSILDQLPQANAIMIEHEVITAEEIFAACEVAKPRPLTRSDAKQKKLMSILNPK